MNTEARENSSNRLPAAIMTARNAPCPCGSGKKFKQCHGGKPRQPAEITRQPNPVFQQIAKALNQGEIELARKLSKELEDSPEKFRLLVRGLIKLRQPSPLNYALGYLQQWRKLQPQSPEPLQRQLEIHLYQGQLSSAEECLREWPAKVMPAEWSYFSAILEQLKGDIEKALLHYSQAISLQRSLTGLAPFDPTTLAVASAMQMYETAAGNYPGSPKRSEEGMFGSEQALEQLERSLLSWEQHPGSENAAQEIKHSHANAWYNLGCAALANFTANDRRVELFTKAVALDPNHLLARFNQAFACNYSFSADPQQIFDAHQQAAKWLESTAPPILSRSHKANQRIRLAYLSSDFRQHSVAQFILPVLQHHDPGRFEVFVYHNHRQDDDQTALARQYAEHFQNVARLSDEQLAATFRSDQIDILIDLNGLTGGHRLAVLAQGAAPLQLNWIGYPNTTGLSKVDFRIVDELTDPPGQSESYCTESLLRLQHPFLSFAAPADLPPVSQAPCLDNGYLTFGSFNALPKLNPPLLEEWAAILKAVPDSRLLIKNLGMDYPRPKAQITHIFVAQGIDERRLVFVGKTPSKPEHLKFYGQVDISLDTFPYHGTTTTCESILMGVPVLSMVGQEHRSRVGLSLMTSLGLESLLANDRDDLVRIATALAAEPEKLQSLRCQLREKLMSSQLTDAATLVQQLEAGLIRLWHNKTDNQGAS